MALGKLKNKNIIIVVLAFGLLAAFIIFLIFRLKPDAGVSQAPATPTSGQLQNSASGTQPPSADQSQWNIYNNSSLGFEFKYPENWVLKDFVTNPDQAGYYDIGVGYQTAEQNQSRTLNYCEAYSGTDTQRCEIFAQFTIDWQSGNAYINDSQGGTIGISLTTLNTTNKEAFKKHPLHFHIHQ